MSYPLKIAWRYFFSKSKQTVINRINAFALLMVLVSTASLFIVLSAFDGLKDFGLSFTNTFDPDFKILPERGTYFYLTKNTMTQIESLSDVIVAAPEIEEKVFLSYNNKTQVAYLRGVSKKYSEVIPIDSLISLGDWLSFEGPDVVVGLGLAGKLGLGIYDYNSFLNISVPKKKKETLLDQNPFTSIPSVVSGFFQINEDLDKKYLFSNIDFSQKLLGLQRNEFSSIIIKTHPKIKKEVLKQKIQPFFDFPIRIVSRADQNSSLYRMLNSEHLAIYFIFCLVMIIALFNVVGALIMMILDKQKQIKILLAMGAHPKGIHNIFFLLGVLICFFGGVFGLFIGSFLVLLQSSFPFIYVPGTRLAYPVIFDFENIFIVFVTLLVLGLISTTWATRGLTNKVRSYTSS